ncbi:hypothetical protein [Nocardiopsis potens]|uniref:hypothetical protein n=1 Tax=Nocardiopsis potens TaxID=1246458 RepID=UPI00034CD580|nr:hypothetical protein [Nocardiopsis potens]
MTDTMERAATEGGVLPSIPGGFDLPFYYGTFINIGADYLVGKAEAEALLNSFPAKGRLSPAEFGGKACLSFNFQVYFAQFAHGTGVTQEIELNVVSYPTALKDRIPKLTYKQYAAGEDQTRNLGFCRVHVPCDAQPAINAGVALFNEPKFKADFDVTLPVPNGTPVKKGDEWTVVWYDTWKVVCGAEGKKGENGFDPKDVHFGFTADLRKLPAKEVSAAPFTEFGSRKDGESGYRALAAPLNVFRPYQWYDLSGQTGRVVLTPGTGAAYGKVKDFIDVIKDVQPAGAWVHHMPPVAVQNRPYYLPE